MNVATITMDPKEARAQAREYYAGLRRSWDEEHAAVARGLDALAEGTPLIDLGAAIRGAPQDQHGRPMLAIARADRRQVEVNWWGTTCAFDSQMSVGTWSETMHRSIEMDFDRPDSFRRGYALVPLVPPQGIRKVSRSGLRFHHILWEVEAWADRPIRATPDRDPYLLHHIGGDLYAVVHEWDLTDLERAVMAGRARRA